MRTGIIGVASSSGSGPGAPGVPLSLTASSTGHLAITCTWSTPTSNGGSTITTYEIDYSTDDGGSWTSGGSVSHPTTTKVFSGLTLSSVYVFRVRAQNAIGYGPYTSKSNSVEAVTGPIPVVTGGTLTSDSTYYYRTFTSSGTLSISTASLNFDYVLVSGGEGGNGHVPSELTTNTQYTATGGRGSLTTTGSTTNKLGSFAVTVGAGGAGGIRSNYSDAANADGAIGSVSSIDTIATSVAENTTYAFGNVATTRNSLAQPRDIGLRGGAPGGSANGGNASFVNNGDGTGFAYAGAGGAGTTVWGTTYGGGGGAASWDANGMLAYFTGVAGAGGSGGGGTGGVNTTNPSAGTANTGGGGGGGVNVTGAYGGAGGSGIVIIRYLKSDVGG